MNPQTKIDQQRARYERRSRTSTYYPGGNQRGESGVGQHVGLEAPLQAGSNDDEGEDDDEGDDDDDDDDDE